MNEQMLFRLADGNDTVYETRIDPASYDSSAVYVIYRGNMYRRAYVSAFEAYYRRCEGVMSLEDATNQYRKKRP